MLIIFSLSPGHGARVLTCIKAQKLTIKIFIQSLHLKEAEGSSVEEYRRLFKLKLDFVKSLLISKSFILQVGFIIPTWKVT